jgi:hypothetical protein
MIMAYGSYAPFYRGGYFNPMQTPQMPQMAENPNQYAQPYQPQVQPTNDMMIWVLNENEATSYPVAPNNSVVLWDKSNPTIYVKSVNGQGVPSMRVLDFTERVANAPKTATEHTCQCGGKFATLEQFDGLQAKISELQGIIEDMQTKSNTKSTKTTKKTEVE